jgi:hypothetical protein
MHGETRKISTNENAMQHESNSYLSFHPMHPVPSMRKSIGTVTSGMLERMGEILIFRDHFSSNGKNSKKLFLCQEKRYRKGWKTQSIQTTVAIWKIAICVSMRKVTMNASIAQIFGHVNGSIDSLSLNNCEESYELLDARDSYNVHFSFDVNTCRDSYFLRDCYGCSDCYGCFGLKNQKYHIFNISYSEDEYKNRLKAHLEQSIESQKKAYQKFLELWCFDSYIPKVMRSENVSDSSRVFDSKNISHSKIISTSENLRYATNFRDTRMGMDIDQWGDRLDQAYECHQVGEASSRLTFCLCCWANTSDLIYSAYCVNNVHQCFGCIWLQNAKYCILNKQYTKEEYEKLVPKIIEKMNNDGEWGEFFPAKFSHFGYNQTMNMIEHPLSESEAKKQWFTWSNYEPTFPKVEKTIPATRLPDTIEGIPDDILNWAILCEVSEKPFRITRLELDFYRRHQLQIPRKHPDERYKERTKIYMNY